MKRLTLPLLTILPLTLGIVLGLVLFAKPEYQARTQLAPQIFASLPDQSPTVLGSVQTGDARPLILTNYLSFYNSPLLPLAHYLVEIADEYKLDFRLLPAIAMQESTLCQFIPGNSHNCWGYGIYGDQVVYFDSYEQGIRTVAQTLARDYLGQGLTTPQEIMTRYTPPSDGSWADAVSLFLDIMEKGGIPE